ncbi:MAG: hypothetical protein BKP49_02820 [Treponema sp. CETP13]|nr:MAG: hypothetical protein BKP49_02820 [Treponema sp. CETP13]
MFKKSLSLVLYAHQEYMHHVDDESHSQWHKSLFPLMTNMYIPLLQAFENMEQDNVDFNVSMVVTPVLCSMLKDPILQEHYIVWLDRLIEFGEAEIKRYESQPLLKKNAEMYLDKLLDTKEYYQNILECDILKKLVYFADKKNVELLGTTATPLFLPHFADFPESINAQIEAGLISHKHSFGIKPDGFWLPFMGYVPGLENYIKLYGYNYTIVDTHGLLFAKPVPKNGIFTPVRTKNNLAMFARNYDSYLEGCNDCDFFQSDNYRCEERDIGYEASKEDLSELLYADGARFETGFKYWSRKSSTEQVYNPEVASQQVQIDAETFLNKNAKKLEEAEKICNTNVSLIDTLYLQDLGRNWYESVEWIEQIFRQANKREDIQIEKVSSLINNPYTLQEVKPSISAATPSGYGQELLDNSNSWMLFYVRKATERMLDLAVRFDENTGLKARILDLAAKELMLAQSSDWAKLVHLESNADFADERFRMCIKNFTTVYESLGANQMSTAWLTEIEKQDMLFEWMNYRFFSPKR